MAASTPGTTAESCDPWKSPAPSPSQKILARSLWTDGDHVHRMTPVNPFVKPLREIDGGVLGLAFPEERARFHAGNEARPGGNGPFPILNVIFSSARASFPAMREARRGVQNPFPAFRATLDARNEAFPRRHGRRRVGNGTK